MTFQERETETNTLMGSVTLNTVTVVGLEAVQSGGRRSVNVTSALTVGAGPLLWKSIMPMTKKATLFVADTGVITVTPVTSRSASVVGAGAGVGDGGGDGVGEGVGSGVGGGVGSGD